MKISIVGLGAMGRLVKDVCQQKKIEVVSTIDPHQKDADFCEITETALAASDVCICFTQPHSAFDNIKQIASLGKKIVMATTGWENNLEKAKKIVIENSTAMIYSSNFSIGANIFFKLIEQSAKIINKFTEYDIMGLELHHNRKLDSPSGTAKTTTAILLKNIKRKKKAIYEKLNQKISEDELHFASLRGGDIVGTHLVNYDCQFDNLEIKHTAKNRLGFATGALIAASWIYSTKKGVFTEKNLIEYLLETTSN